MAQWSGIVAVCIGVVLTALVGLIAYTFLQLRGELKEDVAELKGDIKEARKEFSGLVETNERHTEALSSSYIDLLWRITGAEQFLEKRFEYDPVRIERELRSRGSRR